MNSLEQSRQIVADNIQPGAVEWVALLDARGRVLREDISAPEDMPAFDRSAMDGYAVGPSGAEGWQILFEVKPGENPESELKPDECARIFTGARIPGGTERVVKQEDTEVSAGIMKQVRACEADYIRCRGEDARAGTTLLKSGTRLTPAEIGLLASLGVTHPQVSSRCRIAHIATGDELVDPSTKPGPSQIRDSNSSLVAAFAQEMSGGIVYQQHAKDDLNDVTQKVNEAFAAGADLLLISGGASVGAYDFGRRALEQAGFKMQFEKINLRPGRPLAFASRGANAAFVLPGNPLSHLTVLHCIVRVAFERMAGLEPSLRILNARLEERIELGGDGRDTLWPARVDYIDGEPVATALRWQSSGDMTGLAGLNAFLRCNVPVLDSGARVPCILTHG
jgi:molybdopterin molybdotransferase